MPTHTRNQFYKSCAKVYRVHGRLAYGANLQCISGRVCARGWPAEHNRAAISTTYRSRGAILGAEIYPSIRSVQVAQRFYYKIRAQPTRRVGSLFEAIHRGHHTLPVYRLALQTSWRCGHRKHRITHRLAARDGPGRQDEQIHLLSR